MCRRDVFRAYENEYTIFCPMSNCFELFGLDFLVDEDFRVYLLEVNPGPDFKQTGARLKHVIGRLFEQCLELVLNATDESADMTRVYANEWSIAAHKGGMRMT